MNRDEQEMDEQVAVTIKQLQAIFMPHAAARLAEIRKCGKRFVHYSSAENILNILLSQSLWMRNARCMADFSEIELGYLMLVRIFAKPEFLKAFQESCNAIYPNLAEEALALFNQRWTDIRFNTFIASISEHEDSEDQYGRLSMWRAFSNSSGRAAMVIRLPPENAARGLPLIFSPVGYFGDAEVEAQLATVITNMEASREYLNTVPKETLRNFLFLMLVGASVSIKHRGFQEEKEWRVIYLTGTFQSPRIEQDLKVIGGIPQVIFKIPLKEDPANQIEGLGIPALVDKIIIGPTVYPAPMFTAFAIALGAAGVPEPGSRIVISDIPIRA
jgi:hypothetical protein